jgi:hypothetical protein
VQHRIYLRLVFFRRSVLFHDQKREINMSGVLKVLSGPVFAADSGAGQVPPSSSPQSPADEAPEAGALVLRGDSGFSDGPATEEGWGKAQYPENAHDGF